MFTSFFFRPIHSDIGRQIAVCEVSLNVSGIIIVANILHHSCYFSQDQSNGIISSQEIWQIHIFRHRIVSDLELLHIAVCQEKIYNRFFSKSNRPCGSRGSFTLVNVYGFCEYFHNSLKFAYQVMTLILQHKLLNSTPNSLSTKHFSEIFLTGTQTIIIKKR